MNPPDPTMPADEVGPDGRDAALQRLKEDWRAGRLSAAEHERRAVLVRRARTDADLAAALDGDGGAGGEPGGYVAPVPPVTPAGEGSTLSPLSAPRPAPRKTRGLIKVDPGVAGSIMGLTPLLALIGFFTIDVDHSWLFFLAVPAMGILLYGGQDEDEDDDRGSAG